MMLLLTDKRYALTDMIARLNFVDHADGIVGIGNSTFTSVVNSELFVFQ